MNIQDILIQKASKCFLLVFNMKTIILLFRDIISGEKNKY